MGSNVYIADEMQLPVDVLRKLKEERGFNPEQPHVREHPAEFLYLVGKRHATNPFFNQAVANALNEGGSSELTRLVEKATVEYPNFTLAMSREVFDSLPGETRLYCMGPPFNLDKVGDLRDRMTIPWYRVASRPNVDLS